MSQKLILLVEDDMNLCQSILLILQRAGYLTTATDCVNKAMDILLSGKFNLIISDADMPELRDVLFQKLLVSYPSLPIFILTDQPKSDFEEEYRLLNAHYLPKPVAPECLLDSVNLILKPKYLSIYPNNHDAPCDTY